MLSSSVPRTEIVGKGDYFRFSERDSLALEASFLEVSVLTEMQMHEFLFLLKNHSNISIIATIIEMHPSEN